MKNILFAAAVAAATACTPVYAAPNTNFVGPRIEATAGVDDVTQAIDRSDIVYGAAVGVDLPLGDRFTIGAEATAANVLDNNRVLGGDARLGFALNENILAYGLVGYENYRNFNQNLDGVRVGGGVELSILPNFYTKMEYRYSDLSSNVGRHQGVVGLGLRF